MNQHCLVNFMNFGVRSVLIMQSIVFSKCWACNIYHQHGEYCFLCSLLRLLIKFIVDWFLKTEVGLAIRATGDNKRMIRSLSANTDTLVIIGLGVSNGLVAFSGALIAQYWKVCRRWNGNRNDYYLD